MLRRSSVPSLRNNNNIIFSQKPKSTFQFNTIGLEGRVNNVISTPYKGFDSQARFLKSRRHFTEQEKKHWSSAQWEYFDNLPDFPTTTAIPKSEIQLKKEHSKPLNPAHRTVILLKNVKSLGFQYQEMTIPRRKAAGLVQRKWATYSTPEVRSLLLDSKPEEFHKLIQWKHEKYQLRFTLSRGSLYFYRRAPSKYNDLLFEVTKKDIVNKVWNVLKIPLKEEQLHVEKPIKKPGMYRVFVDIGQNPLVKLRVYVSNHKQKRL